VLRESLTEGMRFELRLEGLEEDPCKEKSPF
jgi:hypothetical protein